MTRWRSVVAQDYREWLGRFPNEPTERMAAALAAVDAFEQWEARRGGTAADLELLAAAARSPHRLVFETGCNLLVRLAAESTEARQCLGALARDRNAAARFHAVAYLDARLPEPLQREIVGLALGDRSAKVREKAVEMAERFRFTDLLPTLEAMRHAERNEAVRGALDLFVPLLRDGYLLRPDGEGGGHFLTVSGPDALTTAYIPASEY